MKQASFQNVGQRLYGRIFRLCEIFREIELEIRIDHRAVAKQVLEARDRHVGHFRARFLELRECSTDDRGDFFVLDSGAEQAANDSEAGTFNGVRRQTRAI